MQQRITKDAFIDIKDDEGLELRNVGISLDKIMEEEFKKLVSCFCVVGSLLCCLVIVDCVFYRSTPHIRHDILRR